MGFPKPSWVKIPDVGRIGVSHKEDRVLLAFEFEEHRAPETAPHRKINGGRRGRAAAAARQPPPRPAPAGAVTFSIKEAQQLSDLLRDSPLGGKR